MKRSKIGMTLGVILITIYVGLFVAMGVEILLGEWAKALTVASTLAVLVVGMVLLGIGAAWMQEWMEDTDRPFPHVPQFTDEQLDAWINEDVLDPPSLLDQGFIVSPEDLDGTEAP